MIVVEELFIAALVEAAGRVAERHVVADRVAHQGIADHDALAPRGFLEQKAGHDAVGDAVVKAHLASLLGVDGAAHHGRQAAQFALGLDAELLHTHLAVAHPYNERIAMAAEDVADAPYREGQNQHSEQEDREEALGVFTQLGEHDS